MHRCLHLLACAVHLQAHMQPICMLVCWLHVGWLCAWMHTCLPAYWEECAVAAMCTATALLQALHSGVWSITDRQLAFAGVIY